MGTDVNGALLPLKTKEVIISTDLHLLSKRTKLLVLGRFRQYNWHQCHIYRDYTLQEMRTDVNGALMPLQSKYVNIGTDTHLLSK